MCGKEAGRRERSCLSVCSHEGFEPHSHQVSEMTLSEGLILLTTNRGVPRSQKTLFLPSLVCSLISGDNSDPQSLPGPGSSILPQQSVIPSTFRSVFTHSNAGQHVTQRFVAVLCDQPTQGCWDSQGPRSTSRWKYPGRSDI